MPNVSATLTAIRLAATRQVVCDAMRDCAPPPSPASVQQIVELVRGNVALAITAPEGNALVLVGQFVSRAGALRFTRLNRVRVAWQLIARILIPGLVNQGAFGMCGPAAVAIDTARNNPLEYVTFAIALAENGRGGLGGRIVTPVAGILNYDLVETAAGGMPAADWIVLASLRDDPATLEGDFSKASYGGSTSDEVFDWMVRSGFQKVIGMSHITLGNSFRCHPVSLMPPTLASSTKLKSLQTAADLKRYGWRIFMQGFMELARSIERINVIADMENRLGAPNPVARAAIATGLATENPGTLGTIWGAIRGTGDTKHWTYVESLTITPGAPATITIACANHGTFYPAVTLPLDGFVNKYLGFVAVTDYA